MAYAVTVALLWFCAIGCGLVAGLYFAFSAFVMRALGGIEARAGMAAMNAINVVILRSPFMPLFFGTTLASLVLAITGLLRWNEPGSLALVGGGAVYVVGMFVCTVAFNVPLNNALAAADQAEGGTQVWEHYVRDWTFWNHVRTIASTAATVLFIVALVASR